MKGAITSFTPYIWGEILADITGGRVQELAFWLGLNFLITYTARGMSRAEGYLGSKLNYAVESEIKLKLLMRYYTPSDGHILLNDRDVNSYSMDTVRRNIGYYAKNYT